jgi:hypothetical protein
MKLKKYTLFTVSLLVCLSYHPTLAHGSQASEELSYDSYELSDETSLQLSIKTNSSLTQYNPSSKEEIEEIEDFEMLGESPTKKFAPNINYQRLTSSMTEKWGKEFTAEQFIKLLNTTANIDEDTISILEAQIYAPRVYTSKLEEKGWWTHRALPGTLTSYVDYTLGTAVIIGEAAILRVLLRMVI